MKPIIFDDFSGGLTDKDVPGRANRYSACDNFLIDADKKLLQRDGFDIFSATAYQLSAVERVARLVNFDIDSEVLAFQNKKAFAISAGAWAEVQGPGGGSSAQHAFNTNTAASLIEEAQWQHHLFLASDSGDPVVKVFRDSGNTMRLRTAGLPEFTSSLTPTDGGLADAITLINDLRSKMTTHYQANGATAGSPNNLTNGHHATDAALTSQASAVSGSTVASDLPTLITLLNLLRAQYNLHIADAQVEFSGNSLFPFTTVRNYHATPAVAGELFYIYQDNATTTNQPGFQWRHYLNFSLADANYTVPSAAVIADCLRYLNDLRDKWNWHTFATNTHFNAIKWKGVTRTKYGTHKTALSRVEPYTWAKITPNYGPFIQFVKDLYTEYNTHIADTDMHMPLADSTNIVDSGFPTTPSTFWDAVCLLGGVADSFTHHAMEADSVFNQNSIKNYSGTASITSGAATMSVAAGGTADQFKNYFAVPIYSSVGSTPNFIWDLAGDAINTAFTLHANYKCSGSTNANPTVLTFPTTFTQTVAGAQFALTINQFHFGMHHTQIFVPRDFNFTFSQLDFTLQSASSLQGFADLAKSLASYMKAHATAQFDAVNPSSAFPTRINLNNNSFQTYVETASVTGIDGNKIFVHYWPDSVKYKNALTWPQTPMFDASTTWTQARFDTAPTAGSFNYRAVFKYAYTVGSSPFEDRSAPSDIINAIGFINENSGGNTELGKFAATLANVQVYANAANENWAHTDTTNFRKEIYRTLANGTNYYRVDIDSAIGDMTNATTSFSDYSSDTYLEDTGLSLYTNDGSPENNKPPISTGIHIFDNRAFYVVGNKVYQSIPYDPDSVPSDFFEEFDENLVAVSSTRQNAVAFTSTKVARLVGGFDELGRGALTHDVIFNRTGSISSQSVVKADNGIFFAGKDGFYFTDGYQCMRVTDLEKTFRTYTDTAAKRKSIQGTYDNISKRVYFTVTTSGGSSPDKVWVLDLQFGIKPDATPVTTLSKTSGFNPTALTYFNGQIYYGDADGYVFVQTRGRNIDLVKNTGVAATSWDAEAVRWDFKSCHYHYGTEALRKFFQRAQAEFDMQGTNISATITSDADKGRIQSDLPVIRSRKLQDWGDTAINSFVASLTRYPALAGNMVDEWRFFNGDGSLRSNYRALELKTAYCVILGSDDMGTITIANVAGNVYTATLTSLVATRKWSTYSVGYFLKIGGVQYPVTVRTSDSVVRIDATALAAPAAGVPASWELWGYPKAERARLISFGVSTDLVDEQQSMSEGPIVTGGQNA